MPNWDYRATQPGVVAEQTYIGQISVHTLDEDKAKDAALIEDDDYFEYMRELAGYG